MICSRCCRSGHNRLKCPEITAVDAVPPRRIPAVVPFYEDHLEAIRLRLPLLRGDELREVRRLVEARITTEGLESVGQPQTQRRRRW
jgi:hypothetical protein